MIQFSLKWISTVGPKCGGGGWLSQTRPIPRSPDSDNKLTKSAIKAGIYKEKTVYPRFLNRINLFKGKYACFGFKFPQGNFSKARKYGKCKNYFYIKFIFLKAGRQPKLLKRLRSNSTTKAAFLLSAASTNQYQKYKVNKHIIRGSSE